MIFDTIESVLKQPLNKSQKDEIKTSLSSSKLARLSYNQTNISPKPDREILIEIEKINSSFEHERRSLSKHFQYGSPFSHANLLLEEKMSKNDLEPDFDTEEITVDEIERLIDPKSPEQVKSPSHIYLREIILSPEDKQYIELQDKNRRKLFDDAKREAERKILQKKNDESECLLNLKNQQKISKQEFSKYKVENQKENKDLIDSVIQKPKIAQTKTQSSVQEIELNEKEVKKAQEKLQKVVEDLKSIKKRCESSEFRAFLESSFLPTLQKSIEEIDCMTKTDGYKNLNALNEQYEKHSKIIGDLNQRIQTAIEKHRAKLEEDKRIKKMEIEKFFLKNLIELKKAFEELRSENEKQDSNLESKSKFIESLSNENLVHQTNNLKNYVKTFIEQIDVQLKHIEKYSLKNFVETLTEKLSEEVIKNVRDLISKFKTQNDKIKDGIKKIEVDVQKSLEELVEAKKIKEQQEVERQRMKEAKELEDKMAKKALEEKLQKEAQLKLIQKQEEEKKKLQTVNRVQNVELNNKAGINATGLGEYDKISNEFNQIRKEAEDAMNQRDQKMYKFDLQKAINFPLNSLLEDKKSSENKVNFDEKIRTLTRLLSGQTCTVTSTLIVNATKHPKSIDFCLVYLARKLVEKGEETVASRPETSFQYCQVINEILKTNEKFQTILLGQIQEKCPYVIPFYKPRLNGQTDEQYFESLGYKLIEGKIEEDVHFYKRMSGVLHLYFTLLLTSNNTTSYFTIKKAWQWLADVFNMTPRPNITAEMLAIFFKCCGYQLQKFYGKQFVKMVRICLNDYLKMIQSISSEKQSDAAVGRLISVLDQFKKNGNFPEWKN